MWKEGSATKCGCFTLCDDDQMDKSIDGDSWEILSVTVQTELQAKIDEIIRLENLNILLNSDKNDLTESLRVCNKNLADTQTNLEQMTTLKNTCDTNLAKTENDLQTRNNELVEMTDEKTRYQNLFEEVQRLENAIKYHSEMALEKYPPKQVRK